MIQLGQRFRLTPPPLLARVISTKVTHRGLRNFSLLSIVLVLLIIAVLGGQSDAIMFSRPFTPGGAVSFNYLNDIAYHDILLAWQRQHYLAWQRHFSVKKSPVTRKNTSSIQVTTALTLSTEVLQTAAGLEQISMLNIDLTSPVLRLGVVQAHNRLISPAETLSSMANRTGAVAGINGDFFEIHGSDVPIGEEVINGQLLHSPNPDFYAVLGVTSEGRLTIRPEYFSGEVWDGHASYLLYSINHFSEINNGRLVLFTPALGEPVYVGGDPVAYIRPVAGSANLFTVQAVYSSVAWLPALSGRDVLVGSGDAAYWLATTLHQGDRITVTDRVAPDPGLSQAIGGGPQVVKQGVYYNDPYQPAPPYEYSRDPQTAVGVTRDGNHALFAVFDGRLAGPRQSRGMTYTEVASFMLAHGAYNAILMDSGGSSEMVARFPGQHAVSVVNWPSGGYERPVANGLFIYYSDLAQLAVTFRIDRLRRIYSHRP
jgi:hypothetical protein